MEVITGVTPPQLVGPLTRMQRLWKKVRKEHPNATEDEILSRLLEWMRSSRIAAIVPRILITASIREPPAMERCFGTVYGLDDGYALFVPCRSPMKTGFRLRPGLVILDTDNPRSPMGFRCFAFRNGDLQWFVKQFLTEGTWELTVRNQGNPRTDGGMEQQPLRFSPEQWKPLVEQIAPLLARYTNNGIRRALEQKRCADEVEGLLKDLASPEGRARAKKAMHIPQPLPKTLRPAPRVGTRKSKPAKKSKKKA